MKGTNRILTLVMGLSMVFGGAAFAADNAGDSAAYGAALDEHGRRGDAIVVVDEKAAYGAALDEHERHADGLRRALIADDVPGM
jgi:hypothetical protein